VNDRGQLYTIEGLAAAILMVVTAYIILNSTTLFTPGETHVIDLQLQQLGNDALAMMGTPDSYLTTKSNLTLYIENSTGSGNIDFSTNFSRYINGKTDGSDDNLQYSATIYYNSETTGIKNITFVSSRNMTGREHAETVSRLVPVSTVSNPPLNLTDLTPGQHFVLMEVTLWRA